VTVYLNISGKVVKNPFIFFISDSCTLIILYGICYPCILFLDPENGHGL
jgi:hypothetical protein